MRKGKRCLCIVMTIVFMLSFAVPAINVSALDNETTIFNYLTQNMGLNTAAACGVLANIEKESSFRNDVIEYGYTWASGGGYGICQWTNSPRTSSTGRRTNLVNWCQSNGYDYTSLTGQLHFLEHELNTSYYYNLVTSKLKNVPNTADGAYTAGYYWCYYFEVPAGYNTGVSVTRGNYAKNTYWPKYGGVQPDLELDSRYPVPFKSYLISTENVRCYDDASLTSSPGLIYPSDDCVITAVYTNGVVKCDCPWGSTTKTVYVSKSAFINSTMTPSSMTAPQYGVTYLRSDGATSKGYIDAGDIITKVAVSGSYTQIIYPCGDGLRCAWVLSSVLVQHSALSLPQFNCYTISTDKVRCYNEVSLSTSPGLIWPEDDCLVTAVYENGVIQCNCPWDNGSTTKTVYVSASEFLTSYSAPKQMIAPNTALTYLRIGDANNKGWIDPGDSIYVLGTSGSMTQIIYPSSSSGTTFRCAWVYTSDLNKTYTVSYNANGGQGAPGNQTKNYDVNLVLSSTTPTRTGYTFLGWSESSSATAATYGAGGIYTKNETKTLYAVWKANQYNVSYNANGGQNAPEPQVKTHGITLMLSSTQPIRVGYSFLGWSTSADATTAQYSAGASYTSNNAAVFYAVWSPNTYTVAYNSNGGTGVMNTSNHTFDAANELLLNTFSRQGYNFIGWSTSEDSTEVAFTDGQYVFNLSAERDAVVNLYAVWEENVPEYVSGDINGDNTVNNKDLTRLMKYLAGEDVTVQEAALDINGDGNVNNKDLTRLMKYLAGEDVTVY